MPQGIVIAIKPMGSFAEDSVSSMESLSATNAEISKTTWGGEVEILDGDHEGEIGSFKQKGKFDETAKGAVVNVKIKEARNGKIKVKIVD